MINCRSERRNKQINEMKPRFQHNKIGKLENLFNYQNDMRNGSKM